MPKQFANIQEPDIGGGIDKESPLPNIQPTYMADMENVDVIATGGARKRKGFETTGGSLPIPVIKAEQAGTELCLTTPFVLDVSLLNNKPLLVRGRTSLATGGEFDEAESVSHYTGFTTDIAQDIVIGAGNLTVNAETHRQTTQNLIPLSFLSTGTGRTNTLFWTNEQTIDSSFNVDLSYTSPSTGSAFAGVLAIEGANAFVSSTFTGVTGVDSLSIPAATHSLASSNLIAVMWEVVGTDLVVRTYDECQIAPNGDVTINVTVPGTADLVVGLLDVGVDNAAFGEVSAESSLTITIDTDSPFNKVSCYLEPTIGGTLEEVFPNEISWEDGTLSVSFINNTADTKRFSVFYESIAIETSRLCVTATTSATWTDENPDLVIWGLISNEALPASSTAGDQTFWSHWLDTYSAEGQKFPVAALLGKALERQADDTVSLLPDTITRIGADTTVGPLVGEPSTPAPRIEVSDTQEGQLAIESITWQSGTSVEIVATAPDVSVNTAPTVGKDTLTVSGATYPENNGTFTITSFTVSGTDQLTFVVTNPNREDDCWDETETGALTNSYSDSIPVVDAEIFIKGDQVNGAGLEATNFIVIEQDGTTLWFEGARDLETLSGGLRLRAERSLSVLPLRALDGTKTTDTLVTGDSIRLVGEDRNIRVLDTYTFATTDATVVCDENLQLCEVTVADTQYLREGGTVSLFGPITKEVTILSITGATTFTYTLTDETTGTYNCRLRGNCVVLDETLEKDWTIATEVTRPYLWYGIPTVSYTQNPRSLTFLGNEPDSQPIVKSTMSRDSLFAVNGVDAPMKFDGTEIGRAGLPRWQTDLFMRADSDPANGGRIVVDNVTVAYSSITGSVFNITTHADALHYNPGQEIAIVGAPLDTYVIQSVDGTSGEVRVNRQIDSVAAAAGTEIVEVTRYSYYARINLIDANGGIVTSAVVGNEDMEIVLTETAGVEFRFLNLPNLDSYDFGALTLSLFRTKSDSPAGPYYEVTNIPIPEGATYVSYRDSAPDVTLTKLDEVSTSLEGIELGTRWEGPLRSEHITSIDGRIVLGNCQGWPIIDLVLNRGNNPPLENGSDMTGTVTIREDNTQATGQVFEFVDVSGAVSVTFTGGVPAPAIGADTYCYLYRNDLDAPLGDAGWHLTDNSGNLAISDGTYKVVTASLATSIPVLVTGPADAAADLDTNWNEQEQLSAEGRAAQRLSGAINWWQTTLTTAWLTTAAGGSFERGQVRFLQPKVSDTVFEVELDSLSNDLTIFANNLSRGTTAGGAVSISAFTDLFPSRVLISEKNFPDLFNEPQTLVDVQSRNVVDINPDDGQEVTGVATFFGTSTSSAAQKQRTLIVFKETSIYAVDIADLSYQRLETEGKGCTVPSSIVSTRGGIQFANESGIYRLRPDMQIVYVGRKYEKVWRDSDTSKDFGAATYWKFENKYLLRHNDSTCAVFHTTREDQSGIPALTTYENVDALMFANFDSKLLYATRRGSVLQSRQSGQLTDYRDENASIAVRIRSRPHHFGEPSTRKAIKAVVSHLAVPESGTSNVQVATRVNLGGNMEQTDSIRLSQASSLYKPNTYISISSSPSQPRGVFFQVEWTTDEIDKGFEMAFYGMKVTGLTEATLIEAADT